MSTLGKFFGSKFLVRMLKLFILNPEKSFIKSEILAKVNGREASVSPLLRRLASVKFLSSRSTKGVKKYQLNPRFSYLPEIKKLILKEVPMLDNEIIAAIKKIGDIQFAAVGGVLVGDQKGSVDLLAVSDKLNRAKFKKIIRGLEAEIGQEVNFTLMDQSEFSYRYDLYDKFIMAMMEEPNVIVINKLKLDEEDEQQIAQVG